LWQATDATEAAPHTRPTAAGHADHLVACPGQDIGENYSDNGQTALELLNRFSADGWELVGLQDYREGGDGSNYLLHPAWLRVRRPLPYQVSSCAPVTCRAAGHAQFAWSVMR
jgi:hypothetical protein